jgi:3-oxoacyl-[acyl-carrier-protein] synthase III
MRAIDKPLRGSPARWKSTFETHGNCVAASVPLTLHLAVEQKELGRVSDLPALWMSG